MPGMTGAAIGKLYDTIAYRRKEKTFPAVDVDTAPSVLRGLDRRGTEEASDRYLQSVWKVLTAALGREHLDEYIAYCEREGLLAKATIPAYTVGFLTKMEANPTPVQKENTERRNARAANIKAAQVAKAASQSGAAPASASKQPQDVKSSIKLGWEPQGGICLAVHGAMLGANLYVQAMVKRTK
jgi:hypothetical protein